MDWTRNNQRHNDLTPAAKMAAARAFWIERNRNMISDHAPGIFGFNDFLREVCEGKCDSILDDYVRTLNSATRVHNSVQALMYLRGYHAPFDSKNPFESTRHFAAGGGSYTHGYLMRHSSLTREYEHRRRHHGAHAPKRAYTFDEDGEIVCGDPRGHRWTVSDDDENHCYCSRCGCPEF